MNARICVVGAGNWGINHINSLYKINSLAGIVEPNINSDFNNSYKNVRVFTKLDDALKLNFDAFIVATPADTHYSISKKIIESGYNILIEKPITTKLDDAIKLNNLAKKHKVKLMVGHVLLFHPAFIKIKEMIDEGKIGNIQYIYSNRLNLGTVRNYENVLWSFAPHDISLFQFFIEDIPININSSGVDILQKNIHDTTITTLEYPNKVMAHVFVSWLHPFKEHRFVVVGDKGMIHFEDSTSKKPLIFYNKSIKYKNKTPQISSCNGEQIKYKNLKPLDLELDYFISCLNNGPIERGNGDSAVEVMKILTEASDKLYQKS